MNKRIDLSLFPRLKQLNPELRHLFYKGNPALLNTSDVYISIVGTRRATTYGIKVAELFAKHVARRGHVVVSGLADGVDTAAHKAALSVGGKTIGVCACGIDSVYPPQSKKLHQMMEEKGLLVSEHDGVVEAHRFRFPLRNRIVAGLSDIVIVAEAPEKSGALITARYGLEYDCEVVAVPGSIFSINSVGGNRLIEDGAISLCTTNQLDWIVDNVKNGKKTQVKQLPKGRLHSLSEYASRAILEFKKRKTIDPIQLSELLEISVTDALDILIELANEGILSKNKGESFTYVRS